MERKQEVQNLLKSVNEKIEQIKTSNDQIALDFWNEKRVILERKLLEFQFDEMNDESKSLGDVGR